MKTLEVANKFELEHKPAEANGKLYLTQEIWEKNPPKQESLILLIAAYLWRWYKTYLALNENNEFFSFE